MAQVVEHVLGKDEVTSSNLVSSSKNPLNESLRDFLSQTIYSRRQFYLLSDGCIFILELFFTLCYYHTMLFEASALDAPFKTLLSEKRKKMLKRFLSYYKPHKWLFAADMLASLLISLTGMIYPVVTRRMLGTYIPQKMYSSILIAGCLVFGLYVIRMLLQYFVQYYGHIVGVRMQAQMRKDLFRHLENLPFSFYDENETGKIMSRLTHDLFEISELAHHGPENILISSVMIVLSFCYLCSINLYLTLIVFSIVPIMVTVSIYFRKKMRAAFMARRAADARINASVESSITGIRVTKAYTNAEREMEKFGESTDEFVQASNQAHKAMAQFFSSTGFINDVFNVIILIAGGLFLYAGKISFADYSTFIVSINLFLSPVNILINFTEQFKTALPVSADLWS